MTFLTSGRTLLKRRRGLAQAHETHALPHSDSFSQHNSPIWNDIQRALEGQKK